MGGGGERRKTCWKGKITAACLMRPEIIGCSVVKYRIIAPFGHWKKKEKMGNNNNSSSSSSSSNNNYPEKRNGTVEHSPPLVKKKKKGEDELTTLKFFPRLASTISSRGRRNAPLGNCNPVAAGRGLCHTCPRPPPSIMNQFLDLWMMLRFDGSMMITFKPVGLT